MESESRVKLLGFLLMVVFGGSLTLSTASSYSSSKTRQWEREKSIVSAASSSSHPLIINRVASSIVLPIHGNVYPIGFYNVTLNIGQPPKPYFLDPDTGSDLTWLQCDAPCQRCSESFHPLYRPSNDLVGCKDPLCMSLQSSGGQKFENIDQCDYEVEYADGGSSLGVLVRDDFPLNLTNGEKIRPRLALGCGYDQIPGSSSHPMDGVLGLGRGKVSILSQMHSQGLVKNIVGHCLSGRGGGFLFFGDDLYDSSRLVWTPMSRDDLKHYSPESAELVYGGKATGIKNLVVVFDSGSSYSYFNSQTYQALTFLLRRELTGKPLKEAPEDQTLPICWKGRRPVKNVREVRKYFRPLALSFSNGGKSKSLFEIPPEAYLIVSSRGNVCLGILNGTEVGLKNSNIIGDISMQDKMIVYDNEKQAIGWVPAKCEKIPSSGVFDM